MLLRSKLRRGSRRYFGAFSLFSIVGDLEGYSGNLSYTVRYCVRTQAQPDRATLPGGSDYNEVAMPKSKDLELRLQRTEEQLSLFQKISRFMVRDMSLTEV